MVNVQFEPVMAVPSVATMPMKPPLSIRTAGSKGRGIRKSRMGCRNCKLRKVKCDETKPGCKKCAAFGVSCNYRNDVPADLHVSRETVFGDELSVFSVKDLQDYSRAVARSSLANRVSSNEALLGTMNQTLRSAYREKFLDPSQVFQLSIDDLSRVHRFQTRTVLTIGSPKVGTMYQRQLFEMFCQKPYVMHAALTFTAMHDRLINDPTNTRKTDFECYHLSQAAKFFHESLQPPIADGERDAIWATTGIMACISFFSTEASTAEESWPLNEDELPTALEWLKLEDAFKLLFKEVRPDRPDGVFRALFDDAAEKGYLWETTTKSGYEGLPPDLVDLCNVKADSDDFNNPYHTALRNLEKILHVRATPYTRMLFLVFSGRMRTAFKTLLAQRDPRALLLMAYWYSLLFESNWYIVRRARVECESIILYLERYHAHDTAIMRLLEFPRAKVEAFRTKALPTS